MAAAAPATIAALQVVGLGPHHLAFRGEVEVLHVVAQARQVPGARIVRGWDGVLGHGGHEVRDRRVLFTITGEQPCE